MAPKKPLVPRKVVRVEGKVLYSEGNQAWNTIKLKSEFLNEFKQLKEKRSKFSYEMIFERNEEAMIKTLKRLMAERKFIPILMFLYKDV